jgi:hypothetical protein
VVEGQVDDAIGRPGAGTQRLEILEIAAPNLGPGRSQGVGR